MQGFKQKTGVISSFEDQLAAPCCKEAIDLGQGLKGSRDGTNWLGSSGKILGER